MTFLELNLRKRDALPKFGVSFALLTFKKNFWSILCLKYFSAI
jgi:hypothetical protein